MTVESERTHKRGWRRLRRWIVVGLAVLLAPPVIMLALRLYAVGSTREFVYAAADVPARQVGIVFGARVYSSGRLSPMLADRVATAVDLYHAGKIDVLLLSGDNSEAHYNEPAAMARYAEQAGVPREAIVLDYAGFRTYDSCYRARDIFQVSNAILITQDFHLSRALLTCRELGIDAVGVAADVQRPIGYATRSMIYSELRELPATALAVADLLRRPEPTFLGDPLPIAEVRQAQP